MTRSLLESWIDDAETSRNSSGPVSVPVSLCEGFSPITCYCHVTKLCREPGDVLFLLLNSTFCYYFLVFLHRL